MLELRTSLENPDLIAFLPNKKINLDNNNYLSPLYRAQAFLTHLLK
jgi:hypothetical protein